MLESKPMDLLALAALLGVVASTACASPPCSGVSGWKESQVDESSVSSDLHAVIEVQKTIVLDDGVLHYSTLAVGADGTVVLGGAYERGPSHQQTWTVSDVDLRGATVVPTGTGDAWWVVGDGGFAAVTHDGGESWTPSDTGTTADLHAVLSAREGLGVVAVGDEVVLVHRDTWLEAQPPEGGWGQLRGLAQLDHPERRVFAVGLGGVIWSSDDPAGVWMAEESGVDVDLFAVGLLNYGDDVVVVGAAGTVLLRDAAGWIAVDSETTVDFIDYAAWEHAGLLLTAQGSVLEYPGFASVDSFEGTQDIDASGYELLAVGEAGLSWHKFYHQVECY